MQNAAGGCVPTKGGLCTRQERSQGNKRMYPKPGCAPLPPEQPLGTSLHAPQPPCPFTPPPTCMRHLSRSQTASSSALLPGRMSRQSFSWYSAPQISSTDRVSSPTWSFCFVFGVGGFELWVPWECFWGVAWRPRSQAQTMVSSPTCGVCWGWGFRCRNTATWVCFGGCGQRRRNSLL
jgi:hypothetical protein